LAMIYMMAIKENKCGGLCDHQAHNEGTIFPPLL
jgi:hypothetical protein